MTLSQSVNDSLQEAQSHLRNALAFAARGERPNICQFIATLINDIEKIKAMDEVLDVLEEIKSDLSME